VSAFFGQLQVVGFVAHAVGVAGDLEAGIGSVLFQAGGQGIEFVLVGSSQASGVELEIHITHDDEFFLDHYLFNHDHRHYRTTRRVDCHAFRGVGAFVATVHDAIAIRIAITVNPAVRRRHACTKQGPAPGPGRAVYRAQRRPAHAADCGTGGPVGFLQPGTAR